MSLFKTVLYTEHFFFLSALVCLLDHRPRGMRTVEWLCIKAEEKVYCLTEKNETHYLFTPLGLVNVLHYTLLKGD